MGEQSRKRGAQRETAKVDVSRVRQRRGTQRETVPVQQRPRGGQRETVPVADRPPPPRRKRTARSVFTAGGATTGWAVVVIATPLIVCVLAAWFIAGHPGSASDAVRVAGATWLLGHGVPVGIGGSLIGLPPLVITALLAWRLKKAGANTARAIGARDTAAVRSVLLAIVPPYTGVAVIVAALVDSEFFSVPVLRSAGHAALFAVVFALWGALRESKVGVRRWRRLPQWLRRGIRTGGIAALVLLAAGALAAGVSLAANGAAATEILDGYGTGALGVGLICLLYVPTFTIWATSFLLGPGFAVGTGTTVSLVDVVLGPVPAVPLLAALPTQPAPPAATVLLGVPLAVGVLLGVFLARRSSDLRLARLLLASIAAGLVCGALIAIAAYAGSGPLGTGRLATIGPHLWLTALTATGTITVAVAFGAAATRALLGRDRRLR
ncbi:DUF6350 family protein [Phytomonospora sp. NPDC050363]|uniref:cell division protein PerM n=1 Tax=Phytomonospora sp. NPDC050363 TaxID=3155642 RepID=UPI0033DE5EA4